ncbi:MAG: DUF4157 domain-containing protein [bacterium]|nr:DUF4157 domain-containing protein [bacterium]
MNAQLTKQALKEPSPVNSSLRAKQSPLKTVPAYIKGFPLIQRKAACPCDGGCPSCRAVIQPKLTIGQPDDKYEQEADRVADQVMRMPEPRVQRAGCDGPTCMENQEESIQTKSISDGITPLDYVQRQEEGNVEEEEEEPVQAKPLTNKAPPAAVGLKSRISDIKGGGQPLAQRERNYFEPRFNRDFSGVRIHTGDRAAEASKSLSAQAFTLGGNIVFGAGQYNPTTITGRKLLAHELTHVIQQETPTVIRRYTTQDCNANDRGKVAASHQRALAILNAAIARLTADPVTIQTQTLFGYHFGTYANWRRLIVLTHLRADRAWLNSNKVTYECEDDCSWAPSNSAYTYWIFGDIHVCSDWLNSESLTERGESFIHELHHWDPIRGHLDLGYHQNNQDNNTTWLVAVNNADAYSELAQDLYEQP